jgi:hypothetical protein
MAAWIDRCSRRSYMRRKILLPFACVLLFFPHLSHSEEYTFDLLEIEKKPHRLSGYAEFRPSLLVTDRDASLYKLNFYDRDDERLLHEVVSTLQLEGSYTRGIAQIFVMTNSRLEKSTFGWEADTDLFEGFLSLKPRPSWILDAGKKTLMWGKGYAWNPVAFVDRPKDPLDPTLSREGFFVASADYIKSFPGRLKTLAFTPVLVPVYGGINEDFGEEDHLNLAAKLYLLYRDTDIDFLFLSGGSRSARFGVDFSRNLRTNFEVHGEFAWITNFEKRLVDEEGRTRSSRSDVPAVLLGIRYLTSGDTTYIVEYYHNGSGFSVSEMEEFFSFADRGYDTFLETGSEALLGRARNLTEGRYGRMNPMKDYFYLRVSRKDPFDILYFVPSLTWIANLRDRSFSFSPEILYTGITNLELRLRGVWIEGGRFTEYGERQNDYRIELRLRYYF